MKKVLVIMLLVMFLPALGIAEVPNNEPLGTRLNPYKAMEEPVVQIEITATDAVTFEDLNATVTIQLLGELKEAAGLEKINESNFPLLTGSNYFCYQFLITADKIRGDNPITIGSDMFKAFTFKFIQTDVITYFEEVTLLEGTSAYYYVGIHTPGTFPGCVVFDNKHWFFVSFCKLVDLQ